MIDKNQTTTPADEDHEHYAWGASAAKQWRGCAGSIALVQQKRAEGLIPNDTSTEYSREGSTAHDYADKCLKGNIELSDIPEEFREHLTGYIAFARELESSAPADAEVYNEQKIPLFYNKEAKGTLDYAVVSNSCVNILDLKYGAGEYVQAEDNDQLAIYALSLIEAINSDELNPFLFRDDTIVRMFIYQPRHHKFDGVPELWEVTYRDLKDIAIDIEADYQFSKNITPETLDESTDLTPSYDACRFCDARKICSARVLNLFDGLPDEINPVVGEVNIEVAKTKIDDAVRVRAIAKGKEIIKFLNEIEEDSLNLIEQGKHIEGLKTIDGGKGNRNWSSVDEVEKLLRNVPAAERYAPRKLKSPAQIEGVLKSMGEPLDKQSTRFQNRWKELIVQKEGSPKVVLASDPRPARTPAKNMFADELDENDCI